MCTWKEEYLLLDIAVLCQRRLLYSLRSKDFVKFELKTCQSALFGPMFAILPGSLLEFGLIKVKENSTDMWTYSWIRDLLNYVMELMLLVQLMVFLTFRRDKKIMGDSENSQYVSSWRCILVNSLGMARCEHICIGISPSFDKAIFKI